MHHPIKHSQHANWQTYSDLRQIATAELSHFEYNGRSCQHEVAMPSLSLSASLHASLRQLAYMRLLFFVGQMAALGFAQFKLYVDLPWVTLSGCLLLLAALTGFTLMRLMHPYPVQQYELLLHLLADYLLVSLVFYQSGGASNPFVSYYLVPLAYSAALLSWHYTLIVALAGALAYTLLLMFPAPFQVHLDAPEGALNVHIWGMWFNFLLNAVFILVFISRMAETLRQQQAQLRKASEQALRDAQLLSLASESAGLAHELGTPLGNLMLLSDELKYRYPDDPDLQEDVQLMEQQLVLCRENLQAMVKRSQLSEPVANQPLSQWLRHWVQRWQLLRPDAQLAFLPANGDPRINLPSSLGVCLLNLLNNAADAAPGQPVYLSWHCHHDYLELRIDDRGEGPPTTPISLGQTSKEQGLGLGLFLTLTTLEHLGGSLQLLASPQGGTRCELRLPLESFHERT
ncbi:ATP-binding protein [Balneatrix alpica]|uniref:histidine kinase n=1 Tax=Balneatrix alpica TaxID=75684 RepID=A0ABV5ZC41_9GAMM|nr:ATP-binding protein [Balneatrix alpica]